ncbi:MAG: DUF4432 family protein [Clostridia bacterium]|nr:DUF4432 family protein [Clostridia bacterium]
MEERKCGNASQVIFAKDVFIDGKSCVLVRNGALEVLFNKDNALDVSWVTFKGVNISFLSKNGLNDGRREFAGNFEGGFLYTCGMDNVSGCVEGKQIHGSMHYKGAENVYSYIESDAVYVCGENHESALFGKNLRLKRKYCITENTLTFSDTVVNDGFSDTEYVLLYHVNYGYPFLDECLKLDIPAKQSEPLTEIAKKRKSEMFKITPPLDINDEDVYYHTLSEGKVRLYNPEKEIEVSMLYDTADFPVTIEWKSMTSGDYALGIEPSLTRFDRFSMQTIKPKESKNYKIKIIFK